MVQVHQILDQGQAYASAGSVVLAVVSVVETLEKVVKLFLAHSVSCIRHLQYEVPALYVQVCADRHAASGMIVFRGVGKQVVQDFVQFVSVEPALNIFLSQTLEFVFNLLLL